MFSGILGNLFKAREKVARDIERKRREQPDYNSDEEYDEEEKPFIDHLEDLRKTIMRIAFTLLIGLAICFCFYKPLLSVIFQPIETAKLAKIVWVEKEEDGIGGFRLRPYVEKKTTEETSIDPKSEIPDVEIDFAVDPPSATASAPETASPATDPLATEIRELRERLDVLEGKVNGNTVAADGKAQPEETGLRIVALGVPEAFMSALKVCFLGAITLTFPFNLYFILGFILPGLKRKEKRMLWPSLAIGTLLFLVGVAFAYWVALPRVLEFFYGFSQGMGVQSDFRLVEYIKFSTRIILLFGLCFELPVVVMALVKLDVLNYSMMSRTRGYAVVIIFVVAAVITPTPDAVTLILLGLPMVLLYEICIWLAYFLEKRDRELNPEYYADLDAMARSEKTDSRGVPGSAPFALGDRGEGHDEDHHDPYHDDEHGHDWHDDPNHPWHDDGDEEDEGGTPGEPSGEPEKTLEESGEEDAGSHSPSSPSYTRAKLMGMKKSELQAISDKMGLGAEGTKEYLTDMILDHQDLW